MKIRWKISLIIFVFLILIFGVYYFIVAGPSISGETVSPKVLSSQTYYVGIDENGYSPRELLVKVGDVVVWTNYDEVRHTVTSIDEGSLDSGLIEPGKFYFNRFEFSGEFVYRCDLYPTMEGKIVVENQ